MSEPAGPEDRQVAGLVDALHRHEAERTEEIMHEARRRSRQMVREAFSDARRRVAAAIQQEKSRLKHAERTALMKAQTQKRLEAQEEARVLLARGWNLLRDALRRRWASPPSRSEWCRAALERAAMVLRSNRWHVEYATGCSVDELIAIHTRLGGSDTRQLACTERAELEAGLTVNAEGASLDASLGGLLADRARIEGELLAAASQGNGRLDTRGAV